MKKASYPPIFSLRILAKTALLGGFLCAHIATAENIFALTPGVTIAGQTGPNTTGYLDALFPVGQRQSFFYLDPQGLMQDANHYTVSLGSGVRQLVSDKAGILGAYVFGDYNRSPHNNGFWFISPGVERLGDIVDLSANLYVPVGSQHQEFRAAPGESLGIPNYVTFVGHNQFDRVLHSFDSTGIGADAEIGVRLSALPNNPKLYMGGYYFDPKEALDKVQGITARVEMPLTDRLTMVASDGYDNVDHNVAKIGLQYAFGGRKNSCSFQGDLAERMVDPVHRNLVATSGPSRTAQPIAQTYNVPKETLLTKDHIAFFNGGDSKVEGDGTYEHPFHNMTQSNVDTANTDGDRNFYVNTGTYKLEGARLTNDNLYGRQNFNGNPFQEVAIGDNRPLFQFSSKGGINNIGFIVNGGSNSVFDSIRLQGGTPGNPGKGTGIFLMGNPTQETNFTISNSDVAYFDSGLRSGMLNDLHVSMMNDNFSNNRSLGVELAAVNNLDVTARGVTVEGSVDGLDLEAGNHLNAQLQDVHFDKNSANGFLWKAYDANISILNASFNNNTKYGVYGRATHNGTISTENTSFNGNGKSGFSLEGYGGHPTINMTVKNAHFDGNKGRGLAINNAQNITMALDNVSFKGNAAAGLLVDAVNDVTLIAHGVISSGNIAGLIMSAGKSAVADIQNSRFDNNKIGIQLVAQNANATGPFKLRVSNSSISNNGTGVVGVSRGSKNMTIDLKDATLKNNVQDTNKTSGDGINWILPAVLQSII